jgi:hypothetical protein
MVSLMKSVMRQSTKSRERFRLWMTKLFQLSVIAGSTVARYKGRCDRPNTEKKFDICGILRFI